MARKIVDNPRVEEVYAFIARYWREHNRPPSMREISDGTSVRSTSHVSKILDELRRQNRISMTPRISRSIVIIDQARARP